MNKRPRKSGRGKRDVKPVFRIFTEGQETEINYIAGYIKDYLCKNNCFGERVIVEKPKNHDPYSLLCNAKVLETDQVWIVFDRDGHPKMPQTFEEAKKHGVEIAFSSISFETWVLLHFEYTTKPYAKCENLVSDREHFKKYILDYDKALVNLFATVTVNDGLDKARKHAARMCRENKRNYPAGTPRYEMNPHTDFHLLLDAIDKFLNIKKIKKKKQTTTPPVSPAKGN